MGNQHFTTKCPHCEQLVTVHRVSTASFSVRETASCDRCGGLFQFKLDIVSSMNRPQMNRPDNVRRLAN